MCEAPFRRCLTPCGKSSDVYNVHVRTVRWIQHDGRRKGWRLYFAFLYDFVFWVYCIQLDAPGWKENEVEIKKTEGKHSINNGIFRNIS